jgi:hypothetical protein
MSAVPRFHTGTYLIAGLTHQHVAHTLKQVNAEKRRQRPPPDTSDARSIEYLYADNSYWSDYGNDRVVLIQRFQITRKTKRRIYYLRTPLPMDDHNDGYAIRDLNDYGVGFVDRQEIEQAGDEGVRSRKHWSADYHLYLSPPQPRDVISNQTLAELKTAMAAAHPDRGGSNAAFIEARARYVAARRQARRGVRIMIINWSLI